MEMPMVVRIARGLISASSPSWTLADHCNARMPRASISQSAAAPRKKGSDHGRPV